MLARSTAKEPASRGAAGVPRRRWTPNQAWARSGAGAPHSAGLAHPASPHEPQSPLEKQVTLHSKCVPLSAPHKPQSPFKKLAIFQAETKHCCMAGLLNMLQRPTLVLHCVVSRTKELLPPIPDCHLFQHPSRASQFTSKAQCARR